MDGKAGRPAGEETGDAAPRSVIAAEALARHLGVPASVLSYLEARVPEIRAITEGRTRAYRAQDAMLLAGLAELLYREGLSFREVTEMIRSNERAAIAARGRKRLSGLVAATPARPETARPIPRDAIVRPKGAAEAPREAPRPRPPSPELKAVLADLIECVRLLESAR
ncbi:MerR family transcriptional regulator [Acuticoccus kandeliae]|uniref:MerR family transcriptional regulator n=1 Tax=Acuticoccus kandeliae TaxID=2073160 RepID=UPI001300B6D8|nr:MerR family transcriptional regulator [Acuticoccus kandeliae]